MLKHLVVGLTVFFALPALAGEPSHTPQPLSEAQEAALRDFAASLAVSPPNVELVVKLTPPTTSYILNFAEADSKNMDDRFKSWTTAAGEQFASGVIAHPFADAWNAEIGCGTWSVQAITGTWSHPDGASPSGCPHEQGTSHPGTIAPTGTYSIAVNLASMIGVASQSGGVYMTATFGFSCRYEGSESGKGQCEETLTGITGRYGNTAQGPDQQPASPRSKAVAVTLAAIAAAGAAAYFFRKRFIK